MNKQNILIVIVIGFIAIVSAIIFTTAQHQGTTTPTVPPQASAVPSLTPNPSPVTLVLGVQTKNSGCVVQNNLEDAACTPGAVFANVTKEQVCMPGYSSSVRNVSTLTKDQVFAEYGVTSHSPGQYEVDHLISLELGGSNDMANLWPESAEPRPGFHEKDKVENYLHDQVCKGAMSLEEAQTKIRTNWLQVYQAMP